MVTAVLTGDAPRTLAALEPDGVGVLLLTPVLLLHAHGVAEGAIAVDVCFLARCVITREWAWLRTPWLRAGFAWWGWLTLCSVPIPALGLGEAGLPSLLQGVLIGRFLILIAAMEHAILRDPAPRRSARLGCRGVSGLYRCPGAHSVRLRPQPVWVSAWQRRRELTGPFGRTPAAEPGRHWCGSCSQRWSPRSPHCCNVPVSGLSRAAMRCFYGRHGYHGADRSAHALAAYWCWPRDGSTAAAAAPSGHGGFRRPRGAAAGSLTGCHRT